MKGAESPVIQVSRFGCVPDALPVYWSGSWICTPTGIWMRRGN